MPPVLGAALAHEAAVALARTVRVGTSGALETGDPRAALQEGDGHELEAVRVEEAVAGAHDAVRAAPAAHGDEERVRRGGVRARARVVAQEGAVEHAGRAVHAEVEPRVREQAQRRALGEHALGVRVRECVRDDGARERLRRVVAEDGHARVEREREAAGGGREVPRRAQVAPERAQRAALGPRRAGRAVREVDEERDVDVVRVRRRHAGREAAAARELRGVPEAAHDGLQRAHGGLLRAHHRRRVRCGPVRGHGGPRERCARRGRAHGGVWGCGCCGCEGQGSDVRGVVRSGGAVEEGGVPEDVGAVDDLAARGAALGGRARDRDSEDAAVEEARAAGAVGEREGGGVARGKVTKAKRVWRTGCTWSHKKTSVECSLRKIFTSSLCVASSGTLAT